MIAVNNPNHIRHIYKMQKYPRKKKIIPVATIPLTKEYEPTFSQEGYDLFFANKSNIKQFIIFLSNGNVANAMKCYRIIKEFHRLSNDDNTIMQRYVTAKNTTAPIIWTPWIHRSLNIYRATNSIFPSSICDECLRTCKNLFHHRFCHNCLLQYPLYVSCLRYWARGCLAFVFEGGLTDNVFPPLSVVYLLTDEYLVAQITQFL